MLRVEMGSDPNAAHSASPGALAIGSILAGRARCYGRSWRTAMPFTLNDLEQRVKERAAASAEVSYTRKLLDRGIAHCAKKLGEEAIEVALAAGWGGRERLSAEAAGLVFPLVVVFQCRRVGLAQVRGAL